MKIWPSLSFLLLISSLSAHAQEVTALLGRGIETYFSDGAKAMKSYNKTARKAGIDRRFTEAEIAAEKGKIHHLILSLECVGRSNHNDLNCYKVQPAVFDADQQKITRRGKILLVGDFDSANQAAQPSAKEIKDFFREFQSAYRNYRKTDFIARRSEMIDVSGWNWSSDPVEVSSAEFGRFEYFIMNYDGPDFTIPQISTDPISMKIVTDFNTKLKTDSDAVRAKLRAEPYPVY
jgi:hypothetical protein